MVNGVDRQGKIIQDKLEVKMQKSQYKELAECHYKQYEDVDGLTKMSNVTLFRKPQHGDWWGDWCFMENNTLELLTTPYGHANEFSVYWVDLDRVRSSAEVLDWIAQISKKTWCTEKILANLVWALDDILDLQQNYCSFGIERKLTGIVTEITDRRG